MNTETEREPARRRTPRTPQTANPTALPDPAIDPLASLSLADIEAEIARRRAAAMESRVAQRDRLLGELRSIEREIAALEADLRAHNREPTARKPVRLPPTVTAATARNTTPESLPSAASARGVTAEGAGEPGATIRASASTLAADVSAATPVQSTEVSPTRSPHASDRPQPAPGARPPLSRLVLAVIVETRPQPIALREIIARVRVRLDRERSDLDRAVPQVIRELRASGAIEATGFEEYVATDAGVHRLHG